MSEPRTWPKPIYDKPPVYWTNGGVPYVLSEDIFLSRAGQRELDAAMRLAETLRVAEPRREDP